MIKYTVFLSKHMAESELVVFGVDPCGLGRCPLPLQYRPVKWFL